MIWELRINPSYKVSENRIKSPTVDYFVNNFPGQQQSNPFLLKISKENHTKPGQNTTHLRRKVQALGNAVLINCVNEQDKSNTGSCPVGTFDNVLGA